MKTMYLVWNGEYKTEAVAFDDYDDAHQTSTGEFSQFSTAIGEDFFGYYGDDAPLPIQKIEV